MQNINQVSDLIIKEERRWNEDKLKQLFNHSEVLKILEIHLPAANGTDSTDKMIWKNHPKGTFSSKSFIKILTSKKPSGSHNIDFPWKKYWKVSILAPKLQLFIWRLLKNGVAVAGNISKHIVGINDECKLCNKATETVDHLFIQCEASQEVLFASPLSLRVSPNHNITVKELIKSWLNEVRELLKLKMIVSLLWAIWKTRNNISFNNGKFSIQDTIKEIMYWFNMKKTTDMLDIIPTEKDMLQTWKEQWEPPPSNKVKINFDGAAGSKGYACSAVARDSVAHFCGGKNKTLGFVSAVEAEAHGLLGFTKF